MFENLIECDKNRRSGKKWKYFLATSIVWTAALVSTIAAGIFLYDARLDAQLSVLAMLEPLPPLPPPALGSTRNAATISGASVSKQIVQVSSVPLREAPSGIPAQPAALVQPSYGGEGADLGGYGDPRGVAGGSWNGVPGGVLGAPESSNPPPPPPPQQPLEKPVEKSAPPSMVIRSEGVIRGLAQVRQKPDYPMMARTARVEGEVQVEITIGEDGNVVAARVVNGHALLKSAALDAAKQWRFNPTLLNNKPVKVQGVLTFRFTL